MTTSRNWVWKLFLAICWVIGDAAVWANCASAQITPDGTLPNNSNVRQQGNTFNITGGTPTGSNLFHSFGEFSVPAGGTAYFNNAADIQNIISRVTGGSVSNIDGLIRANGGANLFLINPAGIIFGRGARLDVGGSFAASTANGIRLANGDIFSTNPVEPLPNGLLNVNPNAFLFNQIEAQPIINRSTVENRGLQVPQGKSLLLVGGDVRLEGGRLLIPGGHVELGGVASTGIVGLSIDGDTLRLNFPNGVARADVSLTNAAEVNVAAAGGGSIALNARNVNILGRSGLRAGIKPLSRSVGAQAGDITLNAMGAIKINNGFIYNAVFGDGNGGNLSIDTGQLIIKDGVVATASVSQGNAGNLSVTASDSVELTGTSAGGVVPLDIPVDIPFSPLVFSINVPIKVPIGLIAASIDIKRFIDPNAISNFTPLLPQPGGNAGNLTINTRQLLAQGGATVVASTVSKEQGGNLTVNASEFIKLSGTSTSGAPRGNVTIDNVIPSGLRNEALGSGPNGDLTINTGRLIIQDGAFITAGSASEDEKQGGNLTVNASDSVELIGTASVNGIPSVLATGTRRAGDSINLTINTGQLIVRDGAVVSSGTSSEGQGGDLTVNASDSVELIGTAAFPVSESAYNALLGDAGVSVFGLVAGRPFPSGLITGTAGQGNAGNLTINTGRLVVRDGAQASVSTVGAGNAGRLTVRASAVELTGTSKDGQPDDIIGTSLLSAAVSEGATGNGGDLTIETGQLIVENGAKVSGTTLGSGTAGNLNITARSILLDKQAAISAQTASGNGGDITLRDLDLLVMRRGSEISTTAGTAQAGGNGGNIIINAPNGFIVAAPGENSDITANAFDGKGGTVKIKATGIFYMLERSREDLVRLLGTNQPDELKPQELLTNDITAFSQTSPELTGTVTINTPDIDPTRGLINLPAEPGEPQLAAGCASPSTNASSFIDTGRGGLPDNPRESFEGNTPQVGWVTLNRGSNNNSPKVSDSSPQPTPEPIIEVTSWRINDKGEVILIADASATWHPGSDCTPRNSRMH